VQFIQKNFDSEVNYSLCDAKELIRSFPFSAEAEAGILGAFLLDNNLIEKHIQELKNIDFFVFKNKLIFESIERLYLSRVLIDMVILKDDLVRRGVFDEIGEMPYLVYLQENISVLGLVEQYISIIKEKSYLRRIINEASNIISECYSQNISGISNVVEKAEKLLFDIVSKQIKKSFLPLDSCLKNAFEGLVNIKASLKGVTGITTGFSLLDEMTSGFQPGDLIILAARPSMGKTALALCFAKNAANLGIPVGISSLEMSADQLILRILACDAKIKLSSLRGCVLNSDDWLYLTNSAARLSKMKIFIDDTPMQTISDIRTKARKLVLEHGVRMLVVDYLQLVHSFKKFESRHHEVSEVSRFLKALAKELSIPVIALSQLSRGVESRVDKRPMLSDLRDSGAIEQDADLILFLYRESVYNKESVDLSSAEIIIGKQRNGPTGTVITKYIREYTLFEDVYA
jgi:replicative DNA helicase